LRIAISRRACLLPCDDPARDLIAPRCLVDAVLRVDEPTDAQHWMDARTAKIGAGLSDTKIICITHMYVSHFLYCHYVTPRGNSTRTRQTGHRFQSKTVYLTDGPDAGRDAIQSDDGILRSIGTYIWISHGDI
jgi:hypothetical protein